MYYHLSDSRLHGPTGYSRLLNANGQLNSCSFEYILFTFELVTVCIQFGSYYQITWLGGGQSNEIFVSHVHENSVNLNL
jgi:hypothetical protein